MYSFIQQQVIVYSVASTVLGPGGPAKGKKQKFPAFGSHATSGTRRGKESPLSSMIMRTMARRLAKKRWENFRVVNVGLMGKETKLLGEVAKKAHISVHQLKEIFLVYNKTVFLRTERFQCGCSFLVVIEGTPPYILWLCLLQGLPVLPIQLDDE